LISTTSSRVYEWGAGMMEISTSSMTRPFSGLTMVPKFNLWAGDAPRLIFDNWCDLLKRNILSAMLMAWGPDNFTIPIPPLPRGVAMAAIVLVSRRLIIEYII